MPQALHSQTKARWVLEISPSHPVPCGCAVTVMAQGNNMCLTGVRARGPHSLTPSWAARAWG